MGMLKIKFKKIIWFTLILFLGVSLTLNISASDATNQTTTTNNSNYTQNQYTTTSTTNTTTYSEGEVTNNTTIKVLIYNGAYSIASCVNGIKTALASANNNYLVPGYNFTYSTTTVINTATLSGYDLLAMPGGSSGYDYINSNSISSSAIKNFVSNGHGYLGICAGAYSGTKAVDGYYTAWGLADVRSTHPNHEGLLNLTLTPTGQELLRYTSTLIMAHYNGPAFYASGGDIITFATYADNTINSQGMAAIIGDYYGEGRTVLSGPHPELDPQFPDIVAKLILWAANVSTTPSPDPTPTNSITMSQLGTAANTVKAFYENNNKKLPSTVTIKDQQISMPSFLYLLAKGTVQANSGSTADILLKDVDSSTSISGTIKSGNILKTEYISNAQNIISYIDTFGKAPNYITTSLGNLSFESTVYTYSRIMSFYKTNSRLPNYVAFTASGSTTPTTTTMSQIASAAATVKSYYENNKNLPATVTINNQQISMSTFLNLITTATIQANSGSTAAITILNVQSATSPSGTIQSGNFLKSEYLTIAQSIKNYIKTNNIAPNNVNTTLGNLSYDKAVYLFSKIMSFYKTNSRLPNYVSMS